MQAPEASRLAGPAGRFFTLRTLARSTALGLTLGLLLTACGGGGGSDNNLNAVGSDGKPREVRCAR